MKNLKDSEKWLSAGQSVGKIIRKILNLVFVKSTLIIIMILGLIVTFIWGVIIGERNDTNNSRNRI